MRIVKVLEMDSVATSRAIPANTTRMLRRVVRKVLLTSVTACCVAAAPVRASTPGGSTLWIRVASSAWLTPDRARTTMSDAWPVAPTM
jgi:hypothetical protein